jgi:hypothetical protein
MSAVDRVAAKMREACEEAIGSSIPVEEFVSHRASAVGASAGREVRTRREDVHADQRREVMRLVRRLPQHSQSKGEK